MKILQVVTYISPDGAYGGPLRVAINQAKALSSAGHQVTIAAAAGGFNGQLPSNYDGFPVSLFPAQRLIPKTGFAGLTSLPLLKWLTTAIRSVDAVHVHLARDLITLPASMLTIRAEIPLVVQTHGMIDKSENPLAYPLDRWMTKPVLKAADKILYLTARERSDLSELAGSELALQMLPNGVPISDCKAIELSQGSQSRPEVMYMARMHARKRPLYFVNSFESLKKRWPNTRFSLVGPDEGEGDILRKAIDAQGEPSRIEWTGAAKPEETLPMMSRASIYALPSTDEPFPMSVLEAMSIGLPVVVTETCGLAPYVSSTNAGIVCDHSQEAFTAAIETLISNPQLRMEMGSRGREAVNRDYSITSVAEKLIKIYRTPISHRKAQA